MNEIPEAFGPASVRNGGTVPLGGEQVVAALEAELAGGGFARQRSDGWLVEGLPLLVRSGVWILPLAWEPAGQSPELRAEFSALWSGVNGACWYRQGDPAAVGEGSGRGFDEGYRRSLGAARERSRFWGFGDHAVVAVFVGTVGGPQTFALHVVPHGWVSRARPTDSPDVDLSWTWDDVRRLAQQPGQTP